MRERKPNIEALARRNDVDGLLEAATYQDFSSTSGRDVQDLGIQIRADALVALGRIAPERSHDAMAAGLHDPADEVRCAAVRLLRARHEGGTLANALRWLPRKGRSYELALEAMADLGETVRPWTVADALVHRDDDEMLGGQAIELILALREADRADVTDEVLEFLLGALGDERDIVVERAAELLPRLGPESVEALLDELSSGPNPAEAAYVLGRIADPRALEALVKALRHQDAGVRRESAVALAELQDPAAVEPLLRATRDSDQSVRSQAGAALDRLGTTAVIIGVAALLRPMVEEAAKAAEPESNGRPQRLRGDARSQVRSHAPNGRTPEAPDPQPSEQHGPSPGSPTL